jgi:hypothetical protein
MAPIYTSLYEHVDMSFTAKLSLGFTDESIT